MSMMLQISKDLELKELGMKAREKNLALKDKTVTVPRSVYKADCLKDCKVTILGSEFHIHRFVLAAYSPISMKSFQQHPEVKVFSLNDITNRGFQAVLDFIYDGKLPTAEDANKTLEAFEAAGKLEIQDLKAFTEEKLEKLVDTANAYKIFQSATKYNSDVLKKAAFNVIQEKIVEKKIPVSYMTDATKMKNLINARKKMDDAIKKARDEFDAMII